MHDAWYHLGQMWDESQYNPSLITGVYCTYSSQPVIAVEEDERLNSNNPNYTEELDESVKQVSFVLSEQGTCSTKPTYADVAKRTSVDKVSNRTTSNKSILLRRFHSLQRIQYDIRIVVVD